MQTVHITIKGGLVQDVITQPGVEVVVRDYDNDMLDEEALEDVHGKFIESTYESTDANMSMLLRSTVNPADCLVVREMVVLGDGLKKVAMALADILNWKPVLQIVGWNVQQLFVYRGETVQHPPELVQHLLRMVECGELSEFRGLYTVEEWTPPPAMSYHDLVTKT